METCRRDVSLEWRQLPLLLILAATSTSLPASAQCTPRWVEEFPGGDLEGGSPQAFTVFDDDGAGPNVPALFAGGWFTSAGASPARLAKWDGKKWSPIAIPVASTIYAMAAFDDDGPGPHPSELYVAGAFAEQVLRWDGNNWWPLGAGTNGVVFSLAVFDDDGPGLNHQSLFVGGTFTSAGGVAAQNVARWDGVSWWSLAGGVGSTVRALLDFDPDAAGPAPRELYVGGEFVTAGGISASRVARWNGSSWSALGGGTDGGVHALAAYDLDGRGPGQTALFAGGDFLAAGGASANRIARWNGSSWSALGGGVNDVVDCLAVFDPDGGGPLAPALFVGGDFTVAGSLGANHVATWDGTSWTALSSGLDYVLVPGDPNTSAHAYALAEFDPDGNGPQAPLLYAGGIFTSAGDAVARNIAAWDGSSWSDLGNGMNGVVRASTVFDDDGPGPHAPALIVGGDFTGAGGRSANRIAMWDGSSWSNLRAGMDGTVRAMTVFDGDGPGGAPPVLYAGGDFADAGGPAARIARWDGSSWEPLARGVDGSVHCMAIFDVDGDGPGETELFVGGSFTTAGGVAASGIAKWDGTAWSSVGGGVSGGSPTLVGALAVFDEDDAGPAPAVLYVAGGFSAAGGLPALGLARWNGSSWSAFPGSQDGIAVRAFAVHDEDGPGPVLPALFAGGRFGIVNGVSASNIARWNGSSWSNLRFAVDDRVIAMTVFDADGLGPDLPELYVGGEFSFAGGILSKYIARWNGTQWFPLSTGMGAVSEGVLTLAVFDEDGGGPGLTSLFAGGDFGTAGGLSSAFIARRQGCGSPIGAFCAGDGSVGPCPCGNSGGFGRGCQNSIGSGGALLAATGHAGLTGDTWQLVSSGELAGSLSIFLQGDSAIAPAAFGDGLRCVGGSLKRLFTKGASSGVALAPSGAEPTISIRSAQRGDPIVAGALRHYQTYYRDSNPSFCAAPIGSTFNISNGISAVWGP